MPLDPEVNPKQSQNPQSVDTPSTVDVTGAYHPEADTTLPHAAQGVVSFDAPTIPGYVITHELARGGMGRVLAGRELALDREVAIKMLLPGSDATRFITEARITARLPHPSIPPVYALGTLADGSPYLAMKLVRGKTLADQLKARSSISEDLPRFLQIFEQIAQAVGFAHAQGIIHRDLKPANVMVGAFGEVQVMDWGLAKDARSSARSLHSVLEANPNDAEATVAYPNDTPAQSGDETRSGAILGTPNYMAPEQARGEVATPQSDVFALGGILCSIVTGKPVFSGMSVPETVKQAASGDTSSALERLENCGADKELVQIAKRCLANEVADRPTDGLAVTRLVADYRQGVEARLKLAETAKVELLVREAEQQKRRRVWAGLIVTILVGLIASSVLAWWAYDAKIDADQKRQQAETNLGFARKGNEILGSVFTNLDPTNSYQTLGEFRNILRNNLAHAVRDLEASSIGDPFTVARMQARLGMSLIGLGEGKQASEVLEKAMVTFKSQLGEDHAESLITAANLAYALHANNQTKQALDLFKRTLVPMRHKLGAENAETISAISNYSQCCISAKEYSQAISLAEEALSLSTKVLGAQDPKTFGCKHNLAVCYEVTGNSAQALRLHIETHEWCKNTLGIDHPHTLTSLDSIASIYLKRNVYEKAIGLLSESLTLKRNALGTDHISTVSAINKLARAYQDNGNTRECIQLLEPVYKGFTKRYGTDNPDIIYLLHTLGRSFLRAGRVEDSITVLEQAKDGSVARNGYSHEDTAGINISLARSYKSASKGMKAVALFEAAKEELMNQTQMKDDLTLTTLNELGCSYFSAGKFRESIDVLSRVADMRIKYYGYDHKDTRTAIDNLNVAYCAANQHAKAMEVARNMQVVSLILHGINHNTTLDANTKISWVLTRQGKIDLALSLLELTYKLQSHLVEPENESLLKTTEQLAVIYLMRRKADASPLYERVLIKYIKEDGENHPNTITTMHNLAWAYEFAGRSNDAISQFERAASRTAHIKYRHENAAAIIRNTVTAYEKAGESKKAEHWIRNWSEHLKNTSGGQSLAYSIELARLGSNLITQKRWAESELVLRLCLNIREKNEPNAWTTYNTQSLLGESLLGQKKYADAEPLLLKGYEGMKQREKTIPLNGKKRLPEALDRLIQLYTETNKPDEVKKWQAEKEKLAETNEKGNLKK